MNLLKFNNLIGKNDKFKKQEQERKNIKRELKYGKKQIKQKNRCFTQVKAQKPIKKDKVKISKIDQTTQEEINLVMEEADIKIEHQTDLLRSLKKEKENASKGIQFMSLTRKQGKDALLYPYEPVQLYEEDGIKMVKVDWSYSGIPQESFPLNQQLEFDKMRKEGIMTDNVQKVNMKETTLHLLISIMEERLSDDIILRIRELCLENKIKVELKNEYHRKIFHNFIKFPMSYTLFISDIPASVTINEFCEKHWINSKQITKKTKKGEQQSSQEFYIRYQTLSSYQQALKYFKINNYNVNPTTYNDQTGEILLIVQHLYDEVKKQMETSDQHNQHFESRTIPQSPGMPNEQTSINSQQEEKKGFQIPAIEYFSKENSLEEQTEKRKKEDLFISIQVSEVRIITDQEISPATLVYIKEFYEIFDYLDKQQLCQRAQIAYQNKGPKTRLTHKTMRDMLLPFYEKYQKLIQTQEKLSCEIENQFNQTFSSVQIINFFKHLISNQKLNIDHLTSINELKSSYQEQNSKI